MDMSLLQINMKRFFTLIFTSLLVTTTVVAQVDTQIYSDERRGSAVAASTSFDVNILASPVIAPLNHKVTSSKLTVAWTVDDIFLLGDANNGAVIDDYEITIACHFYEQGNPISVESETAQLTINSEHAVAVFHKDITSLCDLYDLEKVEIEIINISTSVIVGPAYTSQQTQIQGYVANHRKLSASVTTKYGVDVRLEANQNQAAAPVVTGFSGSTQTSRVLLFDWAATTHNFPNYEIQILKLENTNPANTQNDAIEATVNWDNALKIETTNGAKAVRLTVAEGTGFYIWRVRGVGNFYPGGFSNAKNLGVWSNSYPQGLTVNLTIPGIPSTPFAFFLEDPDDTKNWMYSRVIAEGNKIGEGMIYANNLLQTVQTQAYAASSGKSVISQTVMDYLGRPTLNTLPVPMSTSGLNGYQDEFLLNTSGQLYTANDFDANGNIQNPGTVQDNGASAFSYYSENNTSDYTIPDAEGYPFSRTIYLTDGSGRVAESSGIGKVHAIGQGRTSRIFYGTPSDDELIAVFGDEAPPAVNILKTVTLDPNGTGTIAYTTIEGLTIATAMSSVVPDNLLAIDNPGNAGKLGMMVSDEIVVNTLSDSKFISSKVLPLDQQTTIIVDYFPCTQSITAAEGGCPGGNCNFEVRFIVSNIVTGEKFGTQYMDVSHGDCSNAIPGSNFTWYTIEAGAGQYTTNGNQVTLPAGNWKIQKIVTSMTNPATVYEIPAAQQYLAPLVDLVATWMNSTTSQEDLDVFNDMLDTLITNLAMGHTAAGPACVGQPANCFEGSGYQNHFWTGTLGTYFNRMVSDYGFPANFIFNPGYTLQYGFVLDGQGQPTSEINTSQLVMSTSCCGDLGTNIPQVEPYPVCQKIDSILNDPLQELRVNDVLFSDVFRTLYEEIVQDANPTAYLTEWGIGNATGAMNGFGGVAPSSSTDPFQSYFDDMIFHMLTDQYFTGNAVHNGSDWMWESPTGQVPVYNSTGDLIPAGAPKEFYGPYYTCDALYECWYSTIRAYFEMLKTPSGFNIYDGVNEDEDNDASAGGDDGTVAGGHSDDPDSAEGNQGLLQQLVSFIISRKMKSMSDDLAGEGDGSSGASPMALQYDIPNTFMSCTGYKFAAIIDLPQDDSTPLTSANIQSDLGEVNTPILMNDFSEYFNRKEAVYAKEVEEDNGNPPTYTTTLITDKLRYDNIKSPTWMFKYYEYDPDIDRYNSPNFNNITKENVETAYPLSSSAALELSTCYHDFSGMGLCYAPPCIDTDHHNWNAMERYMFFKQVSKTFPADDLDDDPNNSLCGSVPPLEPIDCNDLQEMIDIDFSNAHQSCIERQDYFRSQIVQMLNFNCYEIVECADGSVSGQVSEAQVTEMVNQAVLSCGAYVDALKLACVDPLTCMSQFPNYTEGSCGMLIPKVSGGVAVCYSTERIITLYDPTYKIPEKLSRVRSGEFIPFMDNFQTNCREGSPYTIESDLEDCNEMNIQYSEIINVE